MLTNEFPRKRKYPDCGVGRVYGAATCGGFQDHFIQRAGFGAVNEFRRSAILIAQFLLGEPAEKSNIRTELAHKCRKAFALWPLARDAKRHARRLGGVDDKIVPLYFHQAPRRKPVPAARHVWIRRKKLR